MNRKIVSLFIVAFFAVMVISPVSAAGEATDTMTILEAFGAQEIKLAAPQADFKTSLTLHVPQSTGDLIVARQTIGPLSREDGKDASLASIRLAGASNNQLQLSLKPGDSVPFQLEGVLPDIGLYQTWLTLDSEKDHLIYALKITRTAPDAPADLVIPDVKEGIWSYSTAAPEFIFFKSANRVCF